MEKKDKKELDKLLKETQKILKEMTDKQLSNIEKEIDKAFNEPAKLVIVKDSNVANVKIEGRNISVLIALASLEKAILEKVDPPFSLWEMIKAKVGTRTVGDMYNE